jgi:hypothetical protein
MQNPEKMYSAIRNIFKPRKKNIIAPHLVGVIDNEIINQSNLNSDILPKNELQKLMINNKIDKLNVLDDRSS